LNKADFVQRDIAFTQFNCCSGARIVGILKAAGRGEWIPAPSTLLRTGFAGMTSCARFDVKKQRLLIVEVFSNDDDGSDRRIGPANWSGI
jgi:hypothetical protein